MTLGIVGLVFGLVGFVYGVRCYYELWKWARECQYWRIGIEYKGKTKIDAPLREWMLWARQSAKEKNSGGRIVYHVGGTRIGLITRGAARANFDFKQFRREILIGIFKRTKKSPPPDAKEGKYKAQDDTPQENKVATLTRRT